MRIMIGVGHPKHVHIRKNIINNLERDGHEVKIVARSKDITLYLLDIYGFKYEIVGKNYKNIIKKAYGMFESDIKALKVAKKFKPDILAWGGPYLAHVSALIGKPHIDFTDTEHATLANWLSFPFTDVIITPSCYKGKINPKKHVTYNGYEELAYLHPKYFKPDTSVLDDLGLSKDDRFIILRFVAWKASHDVGQYGISPAMRMQYILKLEKYGKVFIVAEEKLKKEFEKYKLKIQPEKFHSLLYYAQLYIGEGGSTATEAAILGTPSIHVSSTAKYCGNFEDLHKNYRLIYTFSDDRQALDKAIEILEDPDSKRKWRQRREKMLKEKIDVTAFITDFIENFPESFYELREKELENKCSQGF
ncbi:hypothetical protein DRN46_06385 [Thermococci archaeon]|nr:MAG: hypothetical protein DRN46_06385 [Thermococci archaeon]